MTENLSPAAEQLFAALAALRQATADAVSYATLVRQAAAQQPPIQISRQRLSDWFGGKAVPADPAVVRFLVGYLQPRATRTSGHQQHPLSWWLDLHHNAVQQRQANRDDSGQSVAIPRSRHRLGRPIDDCDPLVLGVHPAIQVPGTGPVTALPGYVLRPHDRRLRETADRMFGDGRSRLVTLVGGSSTGKTRACWELVRHIERAQPGRWRLWHPYDPTPPEAAAAAIGQAGPHTIVWLNEAQFYLAPADVHLGERIAAGLRTLLHQDPDRRPVLVLATLWPQDWTALTTRPDAGERDPYAPARDLLAGTAITVPDVFTPDEFAGLDGSEADPRLRQAAAHAEDGRITQYLAGAPELEDRYRMAPPAARAVIQVAMDARRLGHPLALPHALLEQAAPGYLDDHGWDTLGEDWLEQALAYTAQPCRGARGPLTRIRARPGEPLPGGGQPCYRLADYLEQVGRSERVGVYPPDSLWTAFTTTVIDPGLLWQLGEQARARGRYQHAIWLYSRAADHGNITALSNLARMRRRVGDEAGADALLQQAADRGDPFQLRQMAEERYLAGDEAGAKALYERAAERGETTGLRRLAELRRRAWDVAGADALLQQAVDRGDRFAPEELAYLRCSAGDAPGVQAVYRQAADRGDPDVLRRLADLRWVMWTPATPDVEALYRQAIDRGNTEAMRDLAKLRRENGDTAGEDALLRQAADRGDTDALRDLAKLRRKDGDTADVEALYRQAIDRGNTEALRGLAKLRRKDGDTAGAEALYRQAIDRGNTEAMRDLAKLRRKDGDTAGAEALYRQAIDRGNTEAMRDLAYLREKDGDTAGAEAVYRQAIDRGITNALWHLIETRREAGDAASACRLDRFGLTGAGEVAGALEFGSHGLISGA
ncbi:hypothetical protein [Micromonospora sp. CA-246542]|uniref:tetratricopeptide repeat protein n=1 Tax=Micromonospora sp. CA-246542 TaxID=3239959 RepID=UPI003D8D9EB8